MSDGEAGRLTEEALQAAGLSDMRPVYRALLMRLRQADRNDFDEATRRYKEDLEPSIASGGADPIEAWLEYGRWLADRLAGGKALVVDRTGRARPYDPHSTDRDGLVLHVPDDDRAPVILLATPRQPSEPQRLTADLLVR